MDAAAKRKLVEVFIDTDSESESHTSSEMVVVSDQTEGTPPTDEEVGVVSEGEEPQGDIEVVSPEMSADESKFSCKMF